MENIQQNPSEEKQQLLNQWLSGTDWDFRKSAWDKPFVSEPNTGETNEKIAEWRKLLRDNNSEQ